MRRAVHRVLSLRGLDLVLVVYIAFVCALTLVLSLAPPNGNDYDSLVYHLAAPQQYLRAGRIIELPYDHHSYFPFLTEMLFTLGLKWKGAVLAKLFHWLMLPLCCGTLMAMGQRHFSLRAGLLAACLFASIPVVSIEVTTAYIDLSLTAFVLLAFLCFANWLASREGWWLIFSGVFCGFALGTKYFGVLFFGWLFLWALGRVFSDARQKQKPEIRPMLYFAVLTLLIGGGWYLRNWLWTGNPVYPFAYEIFGGKGWTLEMAKGYTRDQAVYGFGRGVLDWLLLPWRVAMAPLNFGQPFWPILNAPLQSTAANGRFEVAAHIAQTFIGPALMAFGVLLIFMRRKPRVIGFLLWSFAFFWMFWAATSQQVRYLLPTLALLCLPCGWGVLQLSERGALLRWTCVAALFSWLVFVPVHTVWRMRSVLPVVIKFRFGDEPSYYLTRTFPAYTAMQWANQNTPTDARFAVYGEPRCFYLERDYFWADDPHNNLIDYTRINSGHDLVSALKSLRATHVLWNTQADGNGGFGAPPPQIEDAINADLLKLLFEARGYRVYQIAGSDA